MLDKPISQIKGIGKSREKLLNSLGIFTVEDVLYYFPRQYEDRRTLKNIRDLSDGETCSVIAEIRSAMSENRFRRNLSIQKIRIGDDSGAAYAAWFNRSYLKRFFRTGQKYIFFGKVNRKNNLIELQNPTYEKAEEGNAGSMLRIYPIYPLTAGISQNIIRNCVKEAFESSAGELLEFLPSWVLRDYKLTGIYSAIKAIHFPDNEVETDNSRHRLVFQELLMLQLGLLEIKNNMTVNKAGIQFEKTPQIDDFIKTLPYKLTNAQQKVYKEITGDMESGRVMSRLIQGDVGSGKTIIAVLAMMKAVYSGYQAVLMAPTEILAEQHYRTISGILANTDLKVQMLTGSRKGKQKENILNDILSGSIDILIGTHAVIQDDVNYKKLGLVITDEQHRFGVSQRAALKGKGKNPDVLVMTATPIPRTLALILYGDLDISVIDEMPPGRIPVKTYSVDENMRERINEFTRKQVKEGRQVFIVCPLIEESEMLDANSAVEMAERISKVDFADLKVGLLHGRMTPAQKEDVMKEFVKGDMDILVSTTVIEVGVDIPNASVMIIENAERYGLAQLHQLRGRVGRGAYQSYCVLYNQSDSEVSKERMRVMEKSTDGFIISSKDLELRGPGEFFGTRQHGIPELAIANLYTDMDILKDAQEAAIKLISDKKINEEPENIRLLKYVEEKVKRNFEKLSL